MADSRTELLREWILNANPEITELGDDTDIIDSRTVTSLQFVEFILYLEKVRGSAIDPDHIDIDSMRTLRAIEKNYLSAAASIPQSA